MLTDQDRKFVYVVGTDKKTVAQGRDARARRSTACGSSTSGLAEGDLVVVNGTRKIFAPGQPVSPTTVPMDQPELQPPAAARRRAK